jgi:hypothetical protein
MCAHVCAHVCVCVCHVCTCACAMMMRQVLTCVAKCARGICVYMRACMCRWHARVHMACSSMCVRGIIICVRAMWRTCHAACGCLGMCHVHLSRVMCTCQYVSKCGRAGGMCMCDCACAGGMWHNARVRVAYYAICSCGIWRVACVCHMPCAYVPCGMCGIIWASCARGCGMLYAPYKHVANGMWASCAMCLRGMRLCGTCTCHMPCGHAREHERMCMCRWHVACAICACGMRRVCATMCHVPCACACHVRRWRRWHVRV